MHNGTLLGIQTRGKYEKNPKHCLKCSNELPYWQRKSKFCTHSCAAKFNNVLRADSLEPCKVCAKPTRKPKRLCTKRCQRKQELADWLNGTLNASNKNGDLLNNVRQYLYDSVMGCQQCSWAELHPITGRCPLEIDHIDGNAANNLKLNLRVLCARCHSMTSTFRGLNKGKGRPSRRKTQG